MFDQINFEDDHAREVQYRRECLQQRTRFRAVAGDSDITLDELAALRRKSQNEVAARQLFFIVLLSFAMPVSPHGAVKTSALHIAKVFIESFAGEWDDGILVRLGTDVCAADEDGDEEMIASHLVNFVMTACPCRLIEIRRVVDEMLWLLSDGR